MKIGTTDAIDPLSRTFADIDLKASIPVDFGRRLKGEGGAELLATVTEMLDERKPRRRALKDDDRGRRDETVSNFLANLAVAAFNRVSPYRFVAFSYDNNTLCEAGLSPHVARMLRTELWGAGLVEGKIGFNQRHHIDIMQRSSRTRLRATPALRTMFEDCGVTWRCVANPNKDIVRLNRGEPDAGPEPSNVVASRHVLARVNALLESSDIILPEHGWAEEAANWTPDHQLTPKEQSNRQHAGDLSATALYRAFTGNWKRGGRLYGGWWQRIPKRVRTAITIDGEPTVEIDYGQQHPTMLFARTGVPLDYDPYVIKGWDPAGRPLGKDTFVRMLNWSEAKDRKRQGMKRVNPALRHLLPQGMSDGTYMRHYRQHVLPIAHWLGINEGAALQVEDSELAISILDQLEQQGIAALPIHDSFIVKSQYRATLMTIMREAFYERYATIPVVR